MMACRDGSKHSNLDCVLPERFEQDKVIHFAVVVTMEDPSCVLFGEETRVVENMDTDVNRAFVCDRVA
jgi:hypothetical protein